jgi:transcriptional regulator with XRE-family HTH domain
MFFNKEIWKYIPGYRELHQASNFGRIKSFRTKFNNKQMLITVSLIDQNFSTSEIAKVTGISKTHILRIRNNPKEHLNNGKILKATLGSHGYLYVTLRSNKKYLVHRLVLETFVGPCPAEMECRHLNGIKTDNRLDNLCWGTRSENMQDKNRHGTNISGDHKGIKNGMSKLNEEKVKKIKKLLKEDKLTQKEIAKLFNVSACTISAIKNGRVWKYVD